MESLNKLKKDIYKSFSQTYIYLKNIAELYNISKAPNQLIVGSQLTLKNLIDIFNDFSTQQSGFEYLSVIAAHIRKIANVSVRNTGNFITLLIKIFFKFSNFLSKLFLRYMVRKFRP